jgi:hypothetical protein
MKITKKAYEVFPVQESIKCAIQILIEEYGFCTPTDALRLAKFDESPAMRSLCLELSESMEYTVIESGKGYRIVDTPIDVLPDNKLCDYEIEYHRFNDDINDIEPKKYFFDCVAVSSADALEQFEVYCERQFPSWVHAVNIVIMRILD